VTGQGRSSSDARPIRVLCLIKGLGRGGAELLVAAQVRETTNSSISYEVAYLTPAKNALVGELESLDVPVTCLRATSSVDARWLVSLRRLLVDHEIDVVHAHSPVAAALARIVVRTLPREHRPRMVTTEHNLWESHVPLTRFAAAVTAPGDDARLAVSSAVRDSMPHRLQAATEVVHHGIDVHAVSAHRAHRDEVRRELGVTENLVVVTVANLRITKGWPDLLSAGRKVLDTVEEACFLAVGQGPMEQEIRRLHDELGLGDRFRLLGFRPDAVRIMAGCDVFCLASHHEGLPIAVMEAMAIGLPVVATDVGGLAELVVDGVHGILVPPYRPDLLAGALIEILTEEVRRQQAAEAVKAKSEELSSMRAIRRMETIYEALARS
jgi:glycosyltransferase involved in cell wall biosynthesis